MELENVILYLQHSKLKSTTEEYGGMQAILQRWLEIIDEDNNLQYYDNSGNAEQARFDRVVAFKNNNFDTLQSNTAAVFNTLTEALTKCGALICSCEEFPAILNTGKDGDGPIFYESVNAAPPVDELLFNNQFCNESSCAGTISDETDNVTKYCSEQATSIEKLTAKLGELQIMNPSIDGYLSVVSDRNEKEQRVKKLFSALKLYVAGINALNSLVVNAFAPLIDEEAKEFHLRDYQYTPDEKKDGTILKDIYIQKLEETRVRIGNVSDAFITVTDENGNPLTDGYGGNQYWYGTNDFGYYVTVGPTGCGVIAAINQYLYLTGQTTITKTEYDKLVKDYLDARDLVPGFVPDNLNIIAQGRRAAVSGFTGALPGQMIDFVSDMSAREGVLVISGWDPVDDYEKDYDHMKDQLKNNIPVIWAVHDFDSSSTSDASDDLTFYKYKDGEYVEDSKASSHYITVVGIYENEGDPNHKRMVEVSSCGQHQYIDYDEYVEWASKNPCNMPFSSITNTAVWGN